MHRPALTLSLYMLFPLNVFSQDLAIEEIIVTATKRAESVQDVPVAISAVDADTIDAMNIDEFTDIAKISPSLTVNRGDWATNSSFSLRGVGTNVFSINIEPSVSIIVDDVALVRSEQAFSDLLDIERIEVLRGPQNTLFGKSASAGVINITTRNPGDEFSARVRVGATDDDESSYSVTLDGPIGDSLGVRLSGYSKKRNDGHIKNLPTGEDLNGSESEGFRAKLRWMVSDTMTATLTTEVSESESDCCHQSLRDVSAGATFLGRLPQALVLGSVVPGEDNDVASVDDLTTTESEGDTTSLRVEIGLGEYELLSVTSYTDWDYQVFRDVDATDFNLLNVFTNGALSGGVVQGGGFELEAMSQEFRLISPVSDSFEYVVGLFYSDIEYGRDFNRGPIFAADWITDTGAETMALYAQGTWALSEQTSITAGLRYNREEIDHDFNNLRTELNFSGSDTETAVPGKISLQRFVNDNVMWFASYSVGYKGQGYDISSSFNQNTSDNPVGSEDSEAFELGIKGTFLNNRLQFNPTIFFVTYDDFQAQQARIVDGVVELGIANVGELETRGIELDILALLSENLRVVGGLAYTDAEITSFSGADCWAGQTAVMGCVPNPVTDRSVQDLGGKDLNNSPKFKFTLSAEYSRSFDTMPFDGYFNASYQWQSDVNFSLLADPGAEQEEYGVLNLSFGVVERKDQRYRVTVFANNVLGEDFVSGIANIGGLWGSMPVYSHVVPREATRYGGVRLELNF